MTDVPVSGLFGVGKTIEKKLKRLNIEMCTDLIFYYPRRFDDFSLSVPLNDLRAGMTATVSGIVQLVESRRSRSHKTITEALISDGTGSVKATWFNQPFIAKNLPVGSSVRLSGKTSDNFFDLSLVNPAYERIFAGSAGVHTGRLVPVYPLTAGITQKQFRSLVKMALDRCARDVADLLPNDIRRRLDLLTVHTALRAIHFPSTADEWSAARRRLAFDELLSLQVAQRLARKALEAQPASSIGADQPALLASIARLPFELTGSQKKALHEILSDMARQIPMNRLLEGDVGSGKTAVSLVAADTAAAAGMQVAYLAPTEILAAQVFETYAKTAPKWNIALCTSKMNVIASEAKQSSEPTGSPCLSAALGTRADRKKILEQIKTGVISMIIGTHALLEDKVQFANLGLAIIDEQHRFGVQQRKILREKNKHGIMPHLLSMTATPIPRSLALTIYGDLDLSILDAVPSGRKKTVTKIVPSQFRTWTYEFVRKQIRAGRQAFVICPRVEPSDVLSAKSVKAEYSRLSKEVFPDLRIGVLHGTMPADKKSGVMSAMLAEMIDILVASSVIEVGIDIPNASVMLIEGAERFGLAQLHQFRGRVGRGPYQSYCFLLPTSEDKAEASRLKALVRSTDGFRLAEEDLRERGAGDIAGNRQSGLPLFKIATLADHDVIAAARKWAEKIISEPKYHHLVEAIEKKDVHLE